MPVLRWLVLTAALILARPAAAQTYTWTGAVNGAWDTATANWSGAGTVWANGAANTAVFDSAGVGTVAVAAGITTGTVQVNVSGYTLNTSNVLALGNTGTAGTFNVASGVTVLTTGNGFAVANGFVKTGAGTLALDDGVNASSVVINFGTGPRTLAIQDGAVRLGWGNSTRIGGFGLDPAPTLTLGNGTTNTSGRLIIGNTAGSQNQVQRFSGLTTAGTGTDNRVVFGGTTGAAFLELNVPTGQTSTFNGTLGGTGTENNMTVSMFGGGTMVLGGANTFNQQVTVGQSNSATTLRLTNALALGSSASATVVRTNATLDVHGQSLAAARSFNVSGTGVGGNGALVNTSGTPATVSGAVVLNALTDAVSVGGIGDLTLAGVVSGSSSSAGLRKVGAGTLTLSNSGNSYAGGTRVEAGTLLMGDANVLPNSGTLHLAGANTVLSTGAAVGFGETDAGTLQVSGVGARIALGSGPHSLTFDAFDNTGFGGLTIDNWDGAAGGRLFFSDISGFTASVLTAITFTGYGQATLSGNELVPVPEPASVLAVSVAGCCAVRGLRRVRACCTGRSPASSGERAG